MSNNQLQPDTPRSFNACEHSFVRLTLPNQSEISACLDLRTGTVLFDFYDAPCDSHHYGMTNDDAAAFLAYDLPECNAVSVVRNLENACHSLAAAASGAHNA